jgi:hypothetical protein
MGLSDRRAGHGGAHHDPAEVGQCEPIRHQFRHLPVHVALLHTGKVLSFGGSGNERHHLAAPLPAELWDPTTGALTTVDQPLDGDLFCVGHAFLPDGRLLVAGGTHGYEGDWRPFGITLPPFAGLEHSYTFDPTTERWTRVGDLRRARWYPTLVTLGDGRVVAMAGLMKRFPWLFRREIELYADGEGWRKLEGADRWLPLYPRAHLLPSGELFYAGSFNTHYTFPFVYWAFPTSLLDPVAGRWRSLGLPGRYEREEGTTVLLPLVPPDYRPRVLLVGGGRPGGRGLVVPDAEVIDLSEPRPAWRSVPPMAHPRYYVYPVILPDRRVLVAGGRTAIGHTHPPAAGRARPAFPDPDPLAVRPIELFDPDAGTWTTVASLACDRLYHANALLLPDGRVMLSGSNPASGVNELRIELYAPPYLFRGPRPSIASAPPSVGYGAAFEIGSPEARDVDEVALIRPSSTTHCLNTDQRYVGLAIRERGASKLVVQVPANRNLAPPGHYMLFLLRDGVPSRAVFVRLG